MKGQNGMGITYNKEAKEFHLYNENVSYIISIMKNNQLGQVYFGKRIQNRSSFSHLMEMEHRPMSSYLFKDDLYFSLEHMRQEYPTYGSGDYKHPALEIKQENGSTLTQLEYQFHRIMKGKPILKGLPATYTEQDDEAETLEVTLKDPITNIELVLLYTIFENESAIARSSRILNNGHHNVHLTTAMSLSLDLPDDNYEMLQLSGSWSRERHIKSRALEEGIQSIESTRGHSSHSHNPFIALKRKHTTETQGEALGFSLVYSGNFLAQIEVDSFAKTRVMMGINPFGFDWLLEPGETFQMPEAVMVFSNQGMNGMSQTYHSLYRHRLTRGEWREKDRPILINNWEATYFDFNEEKLLGIAKTAQEAGIELFVLDDGWFGSRDDETQGLGDWFVNAEKLPSGITNLAEKIEEMDMKFGLWFEPEMVNENSELFKKHPEWVLKAPERPISHGRNQFVLDYAREEVVDAMYEMIANILREAKISYVKWDMNRSMTEVYSKAYPADQQGEIFHRYILGVYKLYERLVSEFPHILFESCASGGGRFDPGMLYYAPQTWTSDDTDAIERLKIQYGTSLVYPISSIGAHISNVPNKQVFRNTPIETRAHVAYFGSFGYELDLNKLSAAEFEKVKQQISFVKQHRNLLHSGTFYRLISPFEENFASWMVVSQDKRQAIVGYYRVLGESIGPYRRLKLEGLNSELSYHIEQLQTAFRGDELMNAGLVVTDTTAGEIKDDREPTTDFDSKIYVLQAE